MSLTFYKSTGQRRLNGLVDPPAGTIVAFAGSGSLPSGWFACNGASLSTASYSALFAAIGYAFGGSGSNFSVPNLLGRAAVGAGQGAGLTNRVLGSTGGAEGVALSAAESGIRAHGSSSPSHGISESNHTHTNNVTGYHSHSNRYNNAAAYKGGSSGTLAYMTQFGGYSYNSTGPQQGKTISVNNSTSAITDGSGNANRVGSASANASQSHPNLQPFIVMRYIIKT